MSNKKTYDQKHLTTSQRIHIEKGLNDGLSLILDILSAVSGLRNVPYVFFATNRIA